MTDFVSVQGRRVEVRRVGPVTDLVIVMLHEGLGSVSTLRDAPDRVAAATGLHVVAYSRFGYGQSDPCDLPRPLDYMTREAVDVLPDLLDALDVRQCILIGHSDGATIAAIHAGSVSSPRVRGLVLMAPHFFTEMMGLASIAAARDAYATTDLRDRLARHHADPDVAFRGWNDAWLDPGFRDWDVTDAIDHIPVPTLAIQGRDDQYGTLAQVEVIEARSYAPVDTLILDDCAHDPLRDQPDAVLTAVADFATRLTRIEAA